MLHGGGRSLEDLRQIRDDQGFREGLELKRMASADATGDWLRRSGATAGLAGLEPVNREVLKRALKKDGRKGYTLDRDATGIEAEKQTALMIYKGFPGDMPMVGHWAQNGLIVGDEFRPANQSPGARNLEFIQSGKRQLPGGKRIQALRCDSAAYPASVINYCQKNGIEFAIGADLDEAVLRAIKAIGGHDWRAYQNGFIAETVHCMNKSKQAFCLIVIRRPLQQSLFDGVKASEKYTVIATNRTASMEAVVRW